MAYADPLAFERARCADIEARARALDVERRREIVRQDHIARHHADQAAYRAGPVARRIRFRRLLKTMRAIRQAFLDGQAAGRERVMEPIHRDGPSLGQRVRGRVRETLARAFRSGRSRGGNVERERSQARERVQERAQQQRQRTREQQKARTSSWAGPEKQRQRTKNRTRGQRVR